jgi:hypothetical protein
MELDSYYKNFKVKSINIEPVIGSEFVLKVDEHNEATDIKTEQFSISISKYMRNNKHLSLPIATFTSI